LLVLTSEVLPSDEKQVVKASEDVYYFISVAQSTFFIETLIFAGILLLGGFVNQKFSQIYTSYAAERLDWVLSLN
jgi:hypothetical protein